MINKIVAISDTHTKHKKLVIPECDLLVVAGDYTFRGRESEVIDFHSWLNKQPARYKLVVQGNHEQGVQRSFAFMKNCAKEQCPDVIFVEHELVELEGFRIFCSAWTPYFHNWAYNAARSLIDAQTMQIPYIKDKWKDIPLDIDAMVCHGPCHGILDCVYQVDGVTPRERVGCWHLLEKFMQTNAKLFISGHIHCDRGEKTFMDKKFYNVSICGETYMPDYEPMVIDL